MSGSPFPVRNRPFAEAPEDFVARLTAMHGLEGRLSFTAFLRRTAERRLDHTALVVDQRTLSYGALFAAIDDAAAWLVHEARLVPGRRAALMIGNSEHYLIWYLAMLAAGIVAVPLNTKLVGREVAFQLTDSEAQLVVTESTHLAVVEAAKAEAGIAPRHFLVDRETPPAGNHDMPPVPKITADAAVYYTSGTTGRPKGVILDHRGMIFMALQGTLCNEYDDPGLVFLSMMPLFHIASHVLTLPVLHLGGLAVIETYATERMLQVIAGRGVNCFFAVPSMLLMMAGSAERHEHDLSGVRVIQYGAAPMATERMDEIQALFPNAHFVHNMGQTESVGLITSLDSARAWDKNGSIGVAIPGGRRRVVDVADQDEEPGTVGELISQGPNMMRGYLNNPDASAETLRGGWLHTGDLGYLDDDGFLYLVDRQKDMIIRGGENIYSTEVEDVLYMHPGVGLAAVVGAPNELFGEEVVAFLQPAEGVSQSADDEITAHCRRHLASFKVPVKLVWLDDFPLTATGKIQKHELKRLLD